MSWHSIGWALWIVGSALVLGSWFNLVSSPVAWAGWIMALAGFGIQFLPWARRESVASKLERLASLHANGSISDEEYEKAKAAAIGEPTDIY